MEGKKVIKEFDSIYRKILFDKFKQYISDIENAQKLAILDYEFDKGY